MSYIQNPYKTGSAAWQDFNTYVGWAKNHTIKSLEREIERLFEISKNFMAYSTKTMAEAEFKAKVYSMVLHHKKDEELTKQDPLKDVKSVTDRDLNAVFNCWISSLDEAILDTRKDEWRLNDGPTYPHDCSACQFLGVYCGQDLYICMGPTKDLVARYSPNLEDYTCGMHFHESSPVMGEAARRAVILGYLTEGELSDANS